MFWEDLNIKEKSDLMRLYISNGIMDLDSIRKHYNSFATGGSLPDHDPKNPYHYHDSEGNKVVISPEDWEANVGKPYFRKIEAAVRAEQAAHPGPEYENNPDFVRDLRSVYKNNMGNNYQNYRYFASALPEGYNFTDEGLIVDTQGNYYVQSGFKQSPRFTYDSDSPLQFTINKGKPIEKTLTFYPVNMDRRVKVSLPVDNTLNIEAEKEKIMQSLNNTYSVDASILGHGFQGDEYESYPVPKGAKIVGNRLVTSDKSILDNLIRNARKNRPDYNNWNIKTNEASIVIPVNPTVTRDGQFTHIDFSTGQPVIKQQSDFNFQAGGKLTFKQWKSQMQSKYPDIEMDNTKAGYDYVRYFNDNYDDAIRQLSKLGHFPDTYKLPNHKTFSNESIYSRGPMMGGNWVNDSTFSPSIINRQQYPNIYKEDRLYTEREIYGNKYQQGGHLYQEGGPTNNKSDWAKAHEVKLALQQLGWGNPNNRLHSDYAAKDSSGYYAGYNLKPVTIAAKHPLWDLPDYRGKEDNPNINAYKNELWENRKEREEAGKEYLSNIGKVGLAVGTLPMLSYGAVATPLSTGLSLVGGEGLNYGINKLTPYTSYGNMLAEGVFNTNNELVQTALEFTNPGFLLGFNAAPFINNQYRGLRVANELRKGINSAKLQPKTIENRGLSDSNYGYRRTQNPNSTLDMGEVWRIENDYNNIVNTNNWSLLPSLRDRHFELLSGNAITDNEGNLLNLWHGTPNGHFNMFRQQGGIGRATNIGFYSTPNKNYASRYTAKDIRWGTPSETPAILELYGRGNLVPDRMLGDFPATVLQHTTPEDVLKIRNLGYDGIRSDNLLGKRAEINLFDPSNYKFKAAVTYDDLGNIIPLSKRDNFSNLDMRYKNGGKLK